MKTKYVVFNIIITFIIIAAGSAVFAADITGNAFKTDSTDHSNITIVLESLPTIPTLGISGIVLLLAALGLLVFRKNNRKKS